MYEGPGVNQIWEDKRKMEGLKFKVNLSSHYNTQLAATISQLSNKTRNLKLWQMKTFSDMYTLD